LRNPVKGHINKRTGNSITSVEVKYQNNGCYLQSGIFVVKSLNTTVISSSYCYYKTACNNVLLSTIKQFNSKTLSRPSCHLLTQFTSYNTLIGLLCTQNKRSKYSPSSSLANRWQTFIHMW